MCRCTNFVMAALIIVFSFWQVAYFKWIIVAGAVIILIGELYMLKEEGCSCGFYGKKTGGKIFEDIKKGRVQKVPSRKEVRETIEK